MLVVDEMGLLTLTGIERGPSFAGPRGLYLQATQHAVPFSIFWFLCLLAIHTKQIRTDFPTSDGTPLNLIHSLLP
jgi:hypothetical protein